MLKSRTKDCAQTNSSKSDRWSKSAWKTVFSIRARNYKGVRPLLFFSFETWMESFQEPQIIQWTSHSLHDGKVRWTRTASHSSESARSLSLPLISLTATVYRKERVRSLFVTHKEAWAMEIKKDTSELIFLSSRSRPWHRKRTFERKTLNSKKKTHHTNNKKLETSPVFPPWPLANAKKIL